MIEISDELATNILDYLYSLKSEWAWKEGQVAGNAEEYKELLECIKELEDLL